MLKYIHMEKHPKSSPRDVFLHLLGFAALYVSAVTLITLLFAYIDYIFPDRLSFYLSGTLDQIRWSSSALIVIFPVFLLVSWMLSKEFSRSPEKRELRFRKWLIYFTLFIAAVTIIVDLIMLIFNFYSGELTVKFFWKILVVLLATGGIFGYYRWELGRSDKKTTWPRTFAWITMAVIAAALVGGFLIVGAPVTQRARRFDDQRVSALQSIQYQVLNYWQQKDKLPEKIDDLRDDINGFIPPRDPETNELYEYKVVDQATRRFQLCGTFKTNSNFYARSVAPVAVPIRMDYYDPYSQNWDHGIGRVCFDRSIDPDLHGLPERKPIPLAK